MQLSEYLEVGKKMKAARTNAAVSQRDMAKQLGLSNSAYSNYENGYSEPPAEVIVKFCDILQITIEQLLGMSLPTTRNLTVKTFADFISILIDLDRRGIPIKGETTFAGGPGQLTAHLSLHIKNPQIATFIPDWNRVNEKLASGLMDEDDYRIWLESTLRIFNVRIEDFL